MNVQHSRPGSVHYPLMTRQDLSQGQLGSFKFVPTDVAIPTFNYYSLLDEIGASDYVQTRPMRSPPLNKGWRRGQQEQYSPVRRSPVHQNSFLVNGAYPDSNLDAQLCAPTLTVRSGTASRAMEHRNSRTSRNDSKLGFPLQDQTNDAMWAVDPTQRGNDVRELSEMTSPVSRTRDLTSMTSRGDFETLHYSLMRALAAEQNAHTATQLELTNLRTQHAQLKAQLESTSTQNRSLLGSVAMLKSLIQHNSKREQSEEGQACDQGEQRAYQPKAITSAATVVSKQDSLLHDTIERQRQKYVHEHSHDQGRETSQTDHIWNLDALEKPRQNSTTDNAGNGSLSRVTSLGQAQKLPPINLQNYSQLIEISPAKEIGNSKSTSDHESLGKGKTRSAGVSKTLGPDSDAKDQSHLSNTGLWNWRDQHVMSDSSSNGSDCELNGPAAEQIDEQILNTQSGNVSYPYPLTCSGPGCVNTLYDPDIKWNVTALNPIFEDEADKYQHLGPASKPDFKGTNFYEYPVRYTPSKGEQNLYRTVMVDFIPPTATYFDVLGLVRGGALESIELFHPILKCAEFKTARLVFNYELGARTLYMRGQNPGLFIDGRRIRVWQVLQPTYPKNKKLEVDVFEKGCTRLLIMDKASPQLFALLPQKLEHFITMGHLIEITHTHDGLPIIMFTSVKAAVTALERLLSDRDFSGVYFDFEPDPCEEPYI